jgi:hypothetical protein
MSPAQWACGRYQALWPTASSRDRTGTAVPSDDGALPGSGASRGAGGSQISACVGLPEGRSVRSRDSSAGVQ